MYISLAIDDDDDDDDHEATNGDKGGAQVAPRAINSTPLCDSLDANRSVQ